MIRILFLSLFILTLNGCDSTEVKTHNADFRLSSEYHEALQALQVISEFPNGAFLTKKLGKVNRTYGGEVVAQVINKRDSLFNIHGPERLSESDFPGVQKKIAAELYEESPDKKDAHLAFAEAIRTITKNYPEVNPMEIMQSLRAEVIQ